MLDDNENKEALDRALEESLGKKGTKRLQASVAIFLGVCIVLFVGFGGSVWNAKSRYINSDSTVTESPSAKPSATKLPEKSLDSSCTTIRTDTTMISTLFTEGKATINQTVELLSAAGSDWREEAKKYSGSKAAWLNKMAELSGKLENYLLTGSPSNGEQLLDQLFANMNLVNQFCD